MPQAKRNTRLVEIPLPLSIDRQRSQYVLPPGFARELQDLEPDTLNGGLQQRRGHRFIQAFDLAGMYKYSKLIAEQNRYDGNNFLWVVARNSYDPADTAKTYYANTTTPGAFAELKILYPDEVTTQSTPDSGRIAMTVDQDAVRLYGATSTLVSRMGWYGRITYKTTGSGRRFNSTSGPTVATPVADNNMLGRNTDGVGDISDFNHVVITLISWIGGSNPDDDDWYWPQHHILRFFFSLLYEGGQESLLCKIGDQDGDGCSFSTNTLEQVGGLTCRIRITVNESISSRVKAIRIYRQDKPFIGRRFFVTQPILLKQFNVYDNSTTGENDYELSTLNWTETGVDTGYWYQDLRDANSKHLSRKTYYQSSLVPDYSVDIYNRIMYDELYPVISPLRRKAYHGQSRSFYWGVTFDGQETWNRLYYSHYNGYGLHCRDIVLALNFVGIDEDGSFPFDIMGVGQTRGYTVIIGNSGYAIGLLEGDPKTDWKLMLGSERVGCVAEKTIKETPYGVVFLSKDGIRIIEGSSIHDEVYGLEVFYEFDQATTLDDYHAEYDDRSKTYFLFTRTVAAGGWPGKTPPLPDNPENYGYKIYALNLLTKRPRTITGPHDFACLASGTSYNGGVVVASTDAFSTNNVGSYRLEDISGGVDNRSGYSAYPAPVTVMETGYMRFLEGENGFQQIRQFIALIYNTSDQTLKLKSFRIDESDSSGSGTLAYNAAVGLTKLLLPASRQPAYSHAFRINKSAAGNQAAMQIVKLWAEVYETEACL